MIFAPVNRIWTPFPARRSPRRRYVPVLNMAAGDRLVDASGQLILNSSGQVRLDDGSGNGCCCTTPLYRQARDCDSNAFIDLWFPTVAGDSSKIVTSHSASQSLPYFFETTSGAIINGKVFSTDAASSTHGTLESDYVYSDIAGCPCIPCEFVALPSSLTVSFSGVTFGSCIAVNNGTVTQYFSVSGSLGTYTLPLFDSCRYSIDGVASPFTRWWDTSDCSTGTPEDDSGLTIEVDYIGSSSWCIYAMCPAGGIAERALFFHGTFSFDCNGPVVVSNTTPAPGTATASFSCGGGAAAAYSFASGGTATIST